MVFEVFLFENTPAILEKTRENEVLLVIYKSEYEAGDSFRNWLYKNYLIIRISSELNRNTW